VPFFAASDTQVDARVQRVTVLDTVMAADTPVVSPPGKRPLYEGSTQYQNWRFSPERLAEIRISLNKTAVHVIRQTFEVDSVRCLAVACLVHHN
jgi:hypothetical protein